MSARPADVQLCCCYRRVWQDGFGARGWKLISAMDDPAVIAATAETGARIPTSVFVHDILDHTLCGLAMSGHRNEAVALIQLATRTGMAPTPDYAQMVDEDFLSRSVHSEALYDFLPCDLAEKVPAGLGDGATIVALLQAQLGRETLRQRLIYRFFELGEAGSPQAQQCFAEHGLDYRRRGPLGLALQQLLELADAFVQQRAWQSATAKIWITGKRCGFDILAPQRWSKESVY